MSYADEYKKSFAIEYGSPRMHHKILDNKPTYEELMRLADTSTDKSVMDKLAHHRLDRVREQIAARSPHKEHLDHLMHDHDMDVRIGVAHNVHAQSHHIDHLMHDSNTDVVSAVARRPGLQPHQIAHLVKHPDPGIAGNVANHHPSSHDLLINHPHNYPRERVAANTQSQEHLNKLVHDPVADVRFCVATNPHATAEHHHILMNDESYHVRGRVAALSKSHSVLQHLSNDRDGAVSHTAKNRLARLQDQKPVTEAVSNKVSRLLKKKRDK